MTSRRIRKCKKDRARVVKKADVFLKNYLSLVEKGLASESLEKYINDYNTMINMVYFKPDKINRHKDKYVDFKLSKRKVYTKVRNINKQINGKEEIPQNPKPYMFTPNNIYNILTINRLQMNIESEISKLKNRKYK